MDEVNYGELFKPTKNVCVVKKDGSLEKFNVQKVIDAVEKSAYRALTKITVDETGIVFIHSIGLTKVICYIDKNNNFFISVPSYL